MTSADHPEVRGERTVLRPPGPGELSGLAARIAGDPRARAWWNADAATVERWLTDPESVALVVTVEGETAGAIMYSEEDDPDYRHASIDIVLLGPFQDRGLGPDALRGLARFLVEERGHHRLTIDPAAENARALSAYEQVGFRPVGIMREYERTADGTWRDGMLMDLLATELGEEPPG